MAFIIAVYETPRSATSLVLYARVSLDFKSMIQPPESAFY